jgi:WD40 repeat protein
MGSDLSIIGREPKLLLWMAQTGESLKPIGSGFFSRAVCAVCFSYDSRYVCAIGSDDQHSLGVWNLQTSKLIVESKASNGVPPQIHSLRCSPERIANTFITAGHFPILKTHSFNPPS